MRLSTMLPWISALSLVSAPLLAAPPEVGRARFPDPPADVAPPPQPEDNSVASEQQSNAANGSGDDLLPPPPPPPDGAQQTAPQPIPTQPATSPPRQSGYWVEPPEPVHDTGANETGAIKSDHQRRRWYGWQILTVDGGTLVFGAMLADMNDEAVVVPVLAGGYLLGGPIVHASHNNWGKALGSAGLRAGLPIAGAFMGAAAADCNGGGDFCGLAGALAGFVLGMATAITVDVAVLAYDAGPEKKIQPRRRGSIDVSPMVGYGNAPTGVQVAGVF